MSLRLLPKPKIPKETRLSLERVAARWRLPIPFARIELEKAGIEFVDIRRAPIQGIRLADLLAYENRIREGPR